MRPQPDPEPRPSRRERRAGRPARPPGRGRVIIGFLLAVLLILLVSLRGIAAFYTDYLWFDSVELSGLWRQVLTTKALLTFAGGLTFFVICWGNLLIAERLAPVFRPSTGDDDLIERYHDLIGRRNWLVRLLVSLFMALLVGVSLGAYWNEWILFRNRVDFGQADATFNTDIGFYVFQLPFLTAAATWLFSSLLVIFVVTLLAHVVNGGIRFHTQLDRVTPQVKAHISVMLAILALVQCGRYWLARYDLPFSTRGKIDGATYTVVNVEQRALYLLMLISLFAVGLFIANIWRRGWVLPGMAVGLWVLVYLIAGTMVPAFVQRVRVEPTESSRERPYVINNINATREAYGLGDVQEADYDWKGELDAEVLAENMGTMSNVRLWNPTSIQDSFRSKQEIKSFYEISDVDVDRYQVGDETREVMIAARDLNTGGLPEDTWEATHLVYTNGWGVVAAEAGDKSARGEPKLLVEDIPVTVAPGLPKLKEPRIYFGENKTGYVIVNTDVRDKSSETAEAEAAITTYDGADGIEIGSGATGFLRKAAFSLRFGEVDPLVSGSLRPDSRVLLERDVTARLRAVAPFLAYDADPYMVMIDGRLQYVVDAYTTTANYPNSQRADTGGLNPRSGLAGRSFNYVRNSVKAVVDAYDGTMTLYVVDDVDPLIKGYQKAFPDLFTPGSEVSDELRSHFRYPEDLFTVQTQMWGRYHVDNADDLLSGRNRWEPPRDVGDKQTTGDKSKALGVDGQVLTDDDRYPSQYLLMQLPGEDEASFVLLRPYVTAAKAGDDSGQNLLRSFIVASSDPGSYGKITSYVLDPSDLPAGPNQAADDMQSDTEVGSQIRSSCSDKTVCTFASPTIVPVGDSLLYVQSFLVAGNQQGAPKIEHVIVNYRNPDGDAEVAIDTSLRGALVQLFDEGVPIGIEDAGAAEPDDPTSPEDPGPGDGASASERESELIDDIVQAFADADAAARDGDLIEYQVQIQKASELASELQDLREAGGETSGGSSGETPTTTEDGDSGGGDGEPTPRSGGTTTVPPDVTTTTVANA